MTRAIDKVPVIEARDRRKLKVAIVSPSRSGTYGLYKAMKMLGYRTYHVVEAMQRGAAHQNAASEALIAANNRLLGHKRYTRADFDKWLGEYDCVCEIPSFVHGDFIDAYLDDPEVKFILTEREPENWVRSMNNTVGKLEIGTNGFPVRMLWGFNEMLGSFAWMASLIYYRWSDGLKTGQKGNDEALRKNYVEYINLVKAKIPADRLKVIKLEDGLDWKDFCPFLGHEIPSEPYPRANDPLEFKDIVDSYINPRVVNAMMVLGATVLPVLGTGLWFAFGNGMTWLRRR